MYFFIVFGAVVGWTFDGFIGSISGTVITLLFQISSHLFSIKSALSNNNLSKIEKIASEIKSDLFDIKIESMCANGKLEKIIKSLSEIESNLFDIKLFTKYDLSVLCSEISSIESTVSIYLKSDIEEIKSSISNIERVLVRNPQKCSA